MLLHSYARLSSGDATDPTGLERLRRVASQIHVLLEADGVGLGHHFEDTADTAGKLLVQREGGSRLAGAVSAGDIVLFPELGRSFRSLRDLIDTCDRLGARGVRLWVQDLGLDSGTEAGRDLLRRLALVDRFQHGLTGERIRAQIRKERAERKAGKVRLRGRPPWGSRAAGKAGNRRLEVQPEEFAVGQLIVQWRLAGHSYQEIAKHLKANGVRKRVRGKRVRAKTHCRVDRPYTAKMCERAYEGMGRLLQLVREGRVTVPKGVQIDESVRRDAERSQAGGGPGRDGAGAGTDQNPGGSDEKA